METVTVALFNAHSRRVLEELQALGVLTINPLPPRPASEQRTFNTLCVSTKGFKFNREEANER